MRKLVFLFVLFATFGLAARAADVTFKASAPEAVVMGETFRLSYTVNAEGKDIRVPEIPDFEVLIGPSTSTNMSTQIINGKMTTSNRRKRVLSISHRQQSRSKAPITHLTH